MNQSRRCFILNRSSFFSRVSFSYCWLFSRQLCRLRLNSVSFCSVFSGLCHLLHQLLGGVRVLSDLQSASVQLLLSGTQPPDRPRQPSLQCDVRLIEQRTFLVWLCSSCFRSVHVMHKLELRLVWCQSIVSQFTNVTHIHMYFLRVVWAYRGANSFHTHTQTLFLLSAQVFESCRCTALSELPWLDPSGHARDRKNQWQRDVLHWCTLCCAPTNW